MGKWNTINDGGETLLTVQNRQIFIGHTYLPFPIL